MSRDALLDAMSLLFSTTDSLREDLTYVRPGTATYTPGTGTATTGDVTYTLRGLFFAFEETDGEIVKPTDRRLELDPNDVTWEPRAQMDYVLTTGGVREEIHQVVSGPTDVSVVLHLRRAG